MPKILIVAIVFLLSCDKDQLCEKVVVETWSNYAGYNGYCRYATNEIDPGIIYMKSDTIENCENKFYKGLDSTYYREINCQRIDGKVVITFKLIVK